MAYIRFDDKNNLYVYASNAGLEIVLSDCSDNQITVERATSIGFDQAIALLRASKDFLEEEGYEFKVNKKNGEMSAHKKNSTKKVKL